MALFAKIMMPYYPEGYQQLFVEEGLDGEPVDNLCDKQECAIIDNDDAMVCYFVFHNNTFLAH